MKLSPKAEESEGQWGGADLTEGCALGHQAGGSKLPQGTGRAEVAPGLRLGVQAQQGSRPKQNLTSWPLSKGKVAHRWACVDELWLCPPCLETSEDLSGTFGFYPMGLLKEAM